MDTRQNRLRLATKYGVHEANGWYAITALVIKFAIPAIVAIVLAVIRSG